MNVKDLNNICGIDGKPLATSSLKKYRGEYKKIIHEYGKIDIDLIANNSEINSAKKRLWFAAAYVYMQENGIECNKEYIKKLSNDNRGMDFAKPIEVKHNIKVVLPKDKRMEIYTNALAIAKNFGVYEHYWNLVIIAAYCIQPPLRNEEYEMMIVVDDEDELEKWEIFAESNKFTEYKVTGVEDYQFFNIINLRTKKMTVNLSKNIRITGQSVIDLVDEFYEALKMWKKEFVKLMGNFEVPWLATSPKMRKITASRWGQKITELTGGCSTALRRNFVSEIDESNIEERIKLAKNMLHTPETSKVYYDKIKQK